MTEPLYPDDETTQVPPAAGVPLDAPPTRGYMARVNLLPRAVVKARRWRQIGITSVGVLVIYLIVLAGFTIVKSSEVNAAERDREAADDRVAVLQQQANELVQYQTLADDIDARETLLVTAMDEQLSWARIFGDLALAFSRDASLTQVDATAAIPEPIDGQIVAPQSTDASEPADGTTEPAAPAAVEPVDGDPESVAQVIFTGYAVKQFAPGVAEVLSNFAQAEGFFDSWLTTAADEKRGDTEVTQFEGRVELDQRAYTRRYDDGLPDDGLSMEAPQ